MTLIFKSLWWWLLSFCGLGYTAPEVHTVSRVEVPVEAGSGAAGRNREERTATDTRHFTSAADDNEPISNGI